jgi:crossover junction endodeoxyribonuclease RusA
MEPITITLPYPPSVNRYWRKWRNRMVISNEGRAYRLRVGGVVLQAGNPTFGDEPVRLDMLVFRPDRRKRDIDNIRKAVYDAIEAVGVLDDDNQIVQDSADKTPDIDRHNPRVVVTITPIEQEADAA